MSESQRNNHNQRQDHANFGHLENALGGPTAGRNSLVHGDKIEGDKVAGDKVSGDKIHGDYIHVERIGDSAQYVIVGKENQIIINSAGKSPLFANVPSMPTHLLGREELIDSLIEQIIKRKPTIFQRLYLWYERYKVFVSAKKISTTRESSKKTLAISVEGLPGVGKTTLATAIAHRLEVIQYFNDGVLWAGLGQQADVMGVLASWAKALGCDVSQFDSLEERTQVVSNAIGQQKLLLIIDDAWNVNHATAVRCGGPNCCHILTTRNQDVAEAFSGQDRVFAIPVLNDDIAYELLQQLAPRACKAEPEKVRQVVSTIGGLPLTLELLGGYLAPSERSRYPEIVLPVITEMLKPEERLELAARRLGSINSAEQSLQEIIMLSLEDETLQPEAVSTFFALGSFAPKPAHFGKAAAQAITNAELVTLGILASRNLLDDSQGLDQLFLHQELANVARMHTPPEVSQRHKAYYISLLNNKLSTTLTTKEMYDQLKWGWRNKEDEFILSLRKLIQNPDCSPIGKQRASALLMEMAWPSLSEIRVIPTAELLGYIESTAPFIGTPAQCQYLLDRINLILEGSLSKQHCAHFHVYRAAISGQLKRMNQAKMDYEQASILIDSLLSENQHDHDIRILSARINLGLGNIYSSEIENGKENGVEKAQLYEAFRLAEKHFLTAASRAQEASDVVLQVAIYSELLYTSNLLEDWDVKAGGKIQEYMGLALDAMERMEESEATDSYRVSVLETLGDLHQKTGNSLASRSLSQKALVEHETAYEYALEVIDILEKNLDNSGDLALAYINAGIYLASMSDYRGCSIHEPRQLACEYLQKGLNEARRVSHFEWEELAEKKLSELCHTSSHNPISAVRPILRWFRLI